MEAFMVRLAASLIGTYFVAFAATNLVVAGHESPPPERMPAAAAAPKADRLDVTRRAASPQAVAEVELIGLDNVLVILRDADGQEVYRVDRASNTTIAARDFVFPQVRLHAEVVEEHDRHRPEAPPQRLPVGSESDGIEEGAVEEQVFACESGISALADRKAASLPRVCLSDASGSSNLHPSTANL
jgi:hypothetical protein